MNESDLDPVACKKILKFVTVTLGDLGTARRDCTGIMGLGVLIRDPTGIFCETAMRELVILPSRNDGELYITPILSRY